MIVFDLRCGAGHVFEAWFGSSGDFEAQRARGLVACPICGASDIAKAVTAARIGWRAGRDEPDSARDSPPVPVAANAETARVKAALVELAKAQAEMLSKSEHVGPRFAAEARAIHAGEAAERPIHGQASVGEARSLIDEGIPVAPLPLPMRDPKAEN